MEVPITQSAEWQKLQDALGEQSFLRKGKDYQFLAIKKHTPAGNYLYCPYGPVAKDQTSFQCSLDALIRLAREQSAIFARIEPRNPAFQLPPNAQKSHDLNPKETWLLDLTGSAEDLKSKLPSRLLRYHKSAAKKGITIETSHDPADIHHLLDLQRALAKEKGINTFSGDYLKTELSQPFATLYLVKYSGSSDHATKDASPASQSEIIAAGLVFDDQTTRYNLQGAQSVIGKKLHATGILTIQLILDAKSKGLQTFDFWGIAPEGATASHPWAGFTAFKKTFLGYEQDYAGTHDLILSPAKYHLYRFLRSLHRFSKNHHTKRRQHA